MCFTPDALFALDPVPPPKIHQCSSLFTRQQESEKLSQGPQKRHKPSPKSIKNYYKFQFENRYKKVTWKQARKQI